jgi:hypothetical protein
MDIVFLVICTVLFALLSPGALLRLPPKGTKYVVVATHALLFFLVLYFLGDALNNAIISVL